MRFSEDGTEDRRGRPRTDPAVPIDKRADLDGPEFRTFAMLMVALEKRWTDPAPPERPRGKVTRPVGGWIGRGAEDFE